MKKIKLIRIWYFVILTIVTMSCTDNDQPITTPSCPSIDILGINFATPTNNTSTTVFGTLDNSTSSSSLSLSTIINVNSNPNYLQMSSTNNAVYDPLTGDYKIVITEEHRVINISNSGVVTNTSIGVSLPYNDITNAPVYSNGNLYYGHLLEIGGDLKFEVYDGSFNPVLSTPISITILSANRSGNLIWNFTSASDGMHQLYFVVDNHIIIYNDTTHSILATKITGITSGSVIGLEFKSTNKLLALHEDWLSSNTKLVEIDVTNTSLITYSDIIDLGFQVNYEFFSTTYNDCNQKYYISTSDETQGGLSHNLRIDLNGPPTIIALPTSYSWNAGLTLKR